MLTVAGFQVPVIPLLEVVFNSGALSPSQIVVIIVNVGEIFGVIVTFIVVTIAHCPASGVNVYDAEIVLLIVDGFQVPVIPLLEVEFKIGAVSPEQIGVIVSNTGVIMSTITFIDVVVAHCPGFGVKV